MPDDATHTLTDRLAVALVAAPSADDAQRECKGRLIRSARRLARLSQVDEGQGEDTVQVFETMNVR